MDKSPFSRKVKSPFFKPTLPELAWPHKAWLTLVLWVLWASILRTRKLLEEPWRCRGSENLQNRMCCRTLHPKITSKQAAAYARPTETSCFKNTRLPNYNALALNNPIKAQSHNHSGLVHLSVSCPFPPLESELKYSLYFPPLEILSWPRSLTILTGFRQ